MHGRCEAVEFFEHMTKIKSATGTYLGIWPAPGLKVAFEKWQAWYRSNAEDLVMDASGSGVGGGEGEGVGQGCGPHW